jgi:hypothetical protein
MEFFNKIPDTSRRHPKTCAGGSIWNRLKKERFVENLKY